MTVGIKRGERERGERGGTREMVDRGEERLESCRDNLTRQVTPERGEMK